MKEDARKLIEVALPLEAINKASAKEKSIRHGHPSTLHLWWARRPLAAARAVLFAQIVDDPSSRSDVLTQNDQDNERERLFKIIEDLVQWENTTNDQVLERAQAEIWRSWRATCRKNLDHPDAKELFDRNKLPAFQDPFAGGGALPLEAQRLGLESYASDLNPVAVLINKAMIEIPPRFAGKPPVNPRARAEKSLDIRQWRGAQGLAQDVRFYGQWMLDEAKRRIGHFYPNIEITPELATGRSDLKSLVGRKLTVIAWLWARTVKSPNPAFAQVHVPLASTFMLCTRPGKEAYIEPQIQAGGYGFTVKTGKPIDSDAIRNGTKLSRGANFRCLMSGTPIEQGYIRGEFKAKRAGERLMAIVAEGEQGRIYLPPTEAMENVARQAKPQWKPEAGMNRDSKDLLSGRGYGFEYWHELFTSRQLVALTTFSDLIQEARKQVEQDALAQYPPDPATCLVRAGSPLRVSGTADAEAYADAVAVYLAFCLDKASLTNTTQATWQKDPDRLTQGFGRQAIPMIWDYAEANPLSDAGGGFGITSHAVAKVLERLPMRPVPGHAWQADATVGTVTALDKIISTDPPYYDNVAYADLSDYFYIWLRGALKPIFPDLFATVAVPKAEELVATPYRHSSKTDAEAYFLNGMTRAMRRLAAQAHPAFPVTICYAFKQAETEAETGTASTGWETFLDAVIRAGFAISGTWPIRTELTGNLKRNIGALASSIVLVCRPRAANAPTATRRAFLTALKCELPVAVAHLQRGNIAPVDLAQAAIGPGMAVYTRYAKVLDAEGSPLSVRDALAVINQTLDEVLTEQDGDFDPDTRWALAWFEQSGFTEGDYGVAETLSKAKNTSVSRMVEARIVASKSGKVRLLKPDELPAVWLATDPSLTAWEIVHQLVRALETGGENATAALVAKLGGRAEIARELAYRLYTVCERKKRAAEALSYNGLVQSWPEILRLAHEAGPMQLAQGDLLA